MPQLHLPNQATDQMWDLRITISPPSSTREALQVVVAVSRGREDPPMPVWVGALPGIESDYLMTLVTEVTSAWAFGERVRDVMKAAASVKRQARDHRARHEY